MINGIDVSHHQGDIDWALVKKSGIQFAIIRTGFGINAPNQTDKKFIQNIEGAKSAGINVGIYHYSYASSSLNASKEAEFCLDIAKDYKLEYPVAYDIEDASISKFTKREKTDMVKSFCDKIEMSGYYAMIYCNVDWLKNHLYADEILPYYDLWLAHWGAKSPAFSCGIWQTTDVGKVDGINGYVDLDIAYKDYAGLIKSKGLNKYAVSWEKECETYTVVKGDTLWGIAKKYYNDGTRWVDIQKYNNINGDRIYPGQILKIKL